MKIGKTETEKLAFTDESLKMLYIGKQGLGFSNRILFILKEI